jgi:hypothetical protein
MSIDFARLAASACAKAWRSWSTSRWDVVSGTATVLQRAVLLIFVSWWKALIDLLEVNFRSITKQINHANHNHIRRGNAARPP